MRTIWLGITAFLLLATSNSVFAKARFMPKGELIETAEIIAVVEVTKIDDASAQGTYWTYRQAAEVLTVRTLKGQLPMRFIIHARKSFICACAAYEAKARYLVFLRREGKLFTTVNHQLGQFKVADKKIKWYLDDRSLAVGERRLDDVIKKVEAAIASNGKKVARALPAAANDNEKVSIDNLIANLSSKDGYKRIAATKEILNRGKDAVAPLRKAGAKQISPFGTIGTRRIDMVYSLVVGLVANPRTNRAGYKTNSFGIHLEKDCKKQDIVAMGKKHGFRLPDSFRADGRPNCYVTLEKGKNLPAVLKAVLLNEPKVVSVNLNYFET